jgi:Zn-finger nucleic acid-binding protein
MNFDDVRRIEEIAVELKYCERCGGLWLRRQGTADVYCGGCCARLTELIRQPIIALERKRPRPVRVDWIRGVLETEVRA